jgi:hypothetical protein
VGGDHIRRCRWNRMEEDESTALPSFDPDFFEEVVGVDAVHVEEAWVDASAGRDGRVEGDLLMD